MATYVWCELVCDHCSNAVAGQFTSGSTLPRKALKIEAVRTGAVFVGDKVYCCVEHKESAYRYAAQAQEQEQEG